MGHEKDMRRMERATNFELGLCPHNGERCPHRLEHYDADPTASALCWIDGVGLGYLEPVARCMDEERLHTDVVDRLQRLEVLHRAKDEKITELERRLDHADELAKGDDA